MPDVSPSMRRVATQRHDRAISQGYLFSFGEDFALVM